MFWKRLFGSHSALANYSALLFQFPIKFPGLVSICAVVRCQRSAVRGYPRKIVPLTPSCFCRMARAVLRGDFGSADPMLLTGVLSAQYGSKPIILVGGFGLAVVLPWLALAYTPLLLGAALFAFGASLGSIDVALNIHAVEVERAAGLPGAFSIYPRAAARGLFGCRSVRSGRTQKSKRFSTKRCAYSDIPSFTSQSAICCIGSPARVTGNQLAASLAILQEKL